MNCGASPLSYTSNNKTIYLKLTDYSLAQFLYCNLKNLELALFLQVKVFVLNSAGGSFCWNYATDNFYSNYAGDNVCWYYVEVVLFVTVMLVDVSAEFMQWLFFEVQLQ